MDANDLTFVRIISPETFKLIPRYLFEQIEDLGPAKNWIDDIYAYGASILMVPNKSGQWVFNPVIFIVVMVDKENIIKGFFWAEIDLIEKHIIVRALSLSKEYQSPNGAVENKVMDYIFSIPDSPMFQNTGLSKKAVMLTSRPKAYERFRFKRSKKIYMEIKDEWRRNKHEDN
jgi:hypothetical protein